LSYVFGDSDLAAERLRLLAEVFAPCTREFLQGSAPGRYGLAVDLGCGPGYSTRLLRETVDCERVVGIDSSTHFIGLARESAGPGMEFCVHDFTGVPFPMGPSDLLFGRFELTHVREPAQLIPRWGCQLRAGGQLLIEETDWIEPSHPALATYLRIVAAMLEDQENQLYVGPILERAGDWPGLRKQCSRVYRFPVSEQTAARMFAQNIRVWKLRPYVQAHHPATEIEGLEAELRALAEGSTGGRESVWGMRQMIFERTDEKGSDR
jgi:trans-aconitate 2-methyltransferase